MLKTIIDIEVLEQFINSRPNTLLLDNIEEQDRWNTFFIFIKSKTDLQLSVDNIDLDSPTISLINTLTTGRKGTKLVQSKFEKPYKDKLPKGTDIQTIYFLNYKKEQTEKLKRKNGLAFISIESYFADWRKVSYDCETVVHPVYEEGGSFQNWNKLNEYIFAITDVVIVDSFIFHDSSLLESNIYKIIEVLGDSVSNKIRLTIVSLKDNKNPKGIITWYDELKRVIDKKKLAINLSIVLTDYIVKQHDRNILTNYFMINSGDSFNYFNSNGGLVTKGTTIRIDSYCNPKFKKLSDDVLRSVKKSITMIESGIDVEKYIIGEVKQNVLLRDK